MATAKKAKTTKAKAVTKKTTAASKKKPVAKKKAVSKKSTTAKTTSDKALICASGQECFWTTDGQILKDLTELRDALDSMADEVFKAHVSKDKNDFADWVEQVLQDAACAEALRKSRKQNSARTVVVRHLRSYQV